MCYLCTRFVPCHLLTLRFSGGAKRPPLHRLLAGLPARLRSVSNQLSRLRVVDHPLKVHDDRWLVSHDPSVVARGEEGHVARPAIELASVVHPNPQHPRDVILEVGGFAALGLGDGLQRGCPSPAALKNSTTDGCTPDLDEFHSSLRK